MPVLPAVASTTSPPGLRSPRFSASRTICLAGRSLTDWPGFMNSALPSMVQPVSSDARLSLIRGVSPIALAIPSRICMILSIWAFNWAVFNGSEANLSGKLRHHKFTKKWLRHPIGALACNKTGAFDNEPGHPDCRKNCRSGSRPAYAGFILGFIVPYYLGDHGDVGSAALSVVWVRTGVIIGSLLACLIVRQI